MRLALAIEYDGTEFFGWQRLSHGRTVQSEIEAALSKVADQPIEAVCAGRTDSGVHAFGQVAHFDTAATRSDYAWMMGCNSLLPDSIAIRGVRLVSEDFHARYSALSRRYRYRILNRPARPGLEHRFVAWERRELDAERMHQAAQALLGEHDFTAFRTTQCQAKHPRRQMHHISVRRAGDELTVDVEANAFLHHMVRNIVGSLLPIGRGDQPVDWLQALLLGRNRAVAGPTAPASGLCFLGPRYADKFGLSDLLESA